MKRRPVIALFILELFSDDSFYTAASGDVEEMYYDRYISTGIFSAKLWLWSQVFRSAPRFLLYIIRGSGILFRNYITTGIRNLLKYKGYSLLNALGLAAGIAVSLLIILWVMDEFSYDKFHENVENLYLVIEDSQTDRGIYRTSSTPDPLAQTLVSKFPEVINGTRFTNMSRILVKNNDLMFIENKVLIADENFVDIFSYPFLSGDPENALSIPNSVLLTESTAEKYFGNSDPIGKTLTINSEHEYMVTGVLHDIPLNSSFRFDLLINWSLMKTMLHYVEGSWNAHAYRTSIKLSENAESSAVSEKIRNLQEEMADDSSITYHLLKYSDYRLRYSHGFTRGAGKITLIYVYITAAITILMTACINFMNLTTARSTSRAREIGLRKVSGSSRFSIIHQFYTESFILVSAASLLAVLLTLLALPSFNEISGKSLSYSALLNNEVVLLLVAVTVLTALVSGSYPAVVLSSFKPAEVFRSRGFSGKKGAGLRKTLVICQFALSIILMILTGMMYRQISYMHTKDPGFERSGLVQVELRGSITENISTLKEELLNDPSILSAAASQFSPDNYSNSASGISWPGMDPDRDYTFRINSVDHDFISTMKHRIVEGRDFSTDISTDSTAAFIMNQQAALLVGKKNVAGMPVKVWGTDGQVIGIVNDFHHRSLRTAIEPVLLMIRPEMFGRLLVRIDQNSTESALQHLEKTWSKFVPDHPIEYTFLDEALTDMYGIEEKMGSLFTYFASFAIFIACLGLFGLSSYTVERRTKEVGIRKVMGAGITDIVFVMSKEFLTCVIVANVIAWPAAWYLTRLWIQNFAYRTDFDVTLFIVTSGIAILMALLTVSGHSLKAAQSNPADSLRHE